MRLFGREAECRTLDALLAGTRGMHSAALVLRGEAGVGKTALLQYADSTATDALRIGGIESEADFPFAALHRLLVPLLPDRERLPARQRAALEVACGLADGPPADLFVVSLATLTLLAGAPRLCIVDDAQWLDRESLRTLAFVARRLHAEGNVLLFGVRAAVDDLELLAGIPVLEVAGLGRDAAVAMLADVVVTDLDPALAEQIAGATGGNPLALADLSRELTAEQLRGATTLPEPVPIGSRLEAHYAARVRKYPDAARTWLLLAAAGAGGSAEQLLEAGRRLGIRPADAAPAEADRLITGSPPLGFRHPLVRSAVYGDAPPAHRRAVHRALALAMAGSADPDRRAWHLAAAADGPDEAVAAELERGADRAAARGGLAARATFLTRAAELTPDPAIRAARRVAAAAAALPAGTPARALRLLDDADEPLLGPVDRGLALQTRAMAAVTTGASQALRDAAAQCLAAAEAFGEADPARARGAVLQAAQHAIGAEDLGRGTTDTQIGAAAARLAGDRPTTVSDLLLAGFAALASDSFQHGGPAMRHAIAVLTGPESTDQEVLDRLDLGVTFCTMLWDDRSRQAILSRAETAARRTGALQALDLVKFMAAMSDATLGRLLEADRHDATGQRLRKAIGLTSEQELVWRHPELVAWRAGPDSRAALLPGLQVFEMLGVGAMRSVSLHGIALLDIALTDYAAARDRLLPMVEFGRPGRYARVLPDLVEAALRAGDRRTAQLACADLTIAVRTAGTPWAHGLLARSEALLSGPEEAEDRFRRAVGWLDGTLAYGDLARTHLMHGEWLRRRRRRRDARAALTTALDMFEAVRANAFANRARQELLALGGVVQSQAVHTEAVLTPQEAAVARLARAGATNAEIAAHLYLSANTVDYHLRKVYRKLGVQSRRQLRSSLHE